MSEPKPKKKNAEPKSFGWMAEYEDENQLLDAARKVRDSGYTRTDAFTPFPVHGIDEALGIKPTILPWFSFFAGATGTLTALTMQWFFNAYDYPYIISGKPFASWPAFIPVTFELTVLFAAFTTVFAMLGLNGLPKFSNPVFTNPKFDRATDDRFFLWVDSRDKYFNAGKVQSLLSDTGAMAVDEVKEDSTPAEVPRGLLITILTLISVTLIPGAIILNMRNSKSGQPRWQVFFDMDYQPKRKTQTKTTIFDDGRVQRQPVPGTIARGDLSLQDSYFLGYDPDATADLLRAEQTQFVSLQETQETETGAEAADGTAAEAQEGGTETEAAEPDAAEQAEEAAGAPQAPATGAPEDNYVWVEEFPEGIVADENFKLGQAKFEQNCAVCHGYGGYGDGLVSQRAKNLNQTTWVQPTSLHGDAIQEQAVGRIYYTITNGKGKMGSYKASLNAKERWAVVLYVRALQRSQNAKQSDVPEGTKLPAASTDTE